MRVALGASLALGLLSGSAVAADLGPYSSGSIKDIPPPDFVPAYSWTGFYLGAQAGYGWGDSSFNADGTGLSAAWDQEGWLAGAYAGFNWQLNSLVLGVEGDVNAAGIDGSTTADGINFSSDIDAVASVRGRLGLAADRWLFFVTGGWAWADGNHTQKDLIDTVSADTTLQGWTFGGGVEYAFTDHIVGRIEGRHYDFDSKTLDMDPPNSSGRFDSDLNTVSAGIAVKF
jgi:outer membrane immunogenic protein